MISEQHGAEPNVWTALPTGRRWEIYGAAATLLVALAAALLPWFSPDLVLVITTLTMTAAWAVLLHQAIRRHGHDDDGFRWALYRHPILGIAVPVVIAATLLMLHDVREILGHGLPSTAHGVIALPLSLAAVPWILALASLALIVMPGTWMLNGIRLLSEGRLLEGSSRVVAASAWLVALFGVVAAVLALDRPTFGRPGFIEKMVVALLGRDDSLVHSSGWLLVAQACFITAIVIAPIAVSIMNRIQRRRAAD